MSGVDELEIAVMLEQARADRERTAIPVDGPIRRTLVGESGGSLVTCVWDDEFFTTLRVLDYDPQPALIRDVFLDRKRAARQPRGKASPSGRTPP